MNNETIRYEIHVNGSVCYRYDEGLSEAILRIYRDMWKSMPTDIVELVEVSERVLEID